MIIITTITKLIYNNGCYSYAFYPYSTSFALSSLLLLFICCLINVTGNTSEGQTKEKINSETFLLHSLKEYSTIFTVPYSFTSKKQS